MLQIHPQGACCSSHCRTEVHKSCSREPTITCICKLTDISYCSLQQAAMTKCSSQLVGKDRSCHILLTLMVLFATCSSFQSNSRTLYVRANGTQCPPAIATSECQTLDWYSKNSSSSFISNTRMVFLEGLHFLNNFIDVSNCNNFSMIGSKTHRSNQLPQPTSQIICTEASKTGFSFINSSKIHITDLALDSCSGMVALKQGLNVPVALAFAKVIDLTLHHVVINNTMGNGLYCYNCLGEVIVGESAFVNAKVDGEKLCSSNANFWFDKPCSNYQTSFRLDTSWLMYGLNNEYACNASGLQLSIFCPRIQVNINSISAYGNIGSSGGNIGISITDFGSDTSTVAISNSTISNGSAVEGGGIKFWSSVESSESTTGESDQFSDILSISNTKFQNNIARSTLGDAAIHVTYQEHYISSNLKSRRISVINCSFINNNAAMAIFKPASPDYSSRNFTVYIDSCTFRHNGVGSSIVKIIGVKHVLLANCNFIENYGSGLYLQSSNLYFVGTVHFESNNALYGGAIKMDDSSVTYLHEGSYVIFVNNTANKGGAIFAQESFEKILPPCILQPITHSSKKVHDLIEVEFVNNSASHGGDAIYGGSLDYCYTSADERISNKSFNKTFTFLDMSKQKGTSTISSDPSGVFFCEKDGSCKGVTANLTIFPGQSFNVSGTTIGQLNGTTAGAIDAIIVDSSYSTLNKVSTKQCSNEQKGCVHATYTLCSNESSVTINFTAITANMNTHRVHINASLHVSLSACPFGFALTETPPYRCDCSPVFSTWLISSQCDINTQIIQSQIQPKTSLWVGCDKHTLFENESVCYFSEAFWCDLYCNHMGHSITITKWNVSGDQQCLPGRTGVLCGACKPGLSRILGSLTKCKVCSNKNLPFLIPLFLLSGWLMIIILTALNMTVSEGTINGLIVYANAMYGYQQQIPNASHVSNRILWSFITWLNFDVGIEACFYNGMDSYQLMWLQYGYAFYLIALQVLIVLLCRRFVLFTRLFRKNVLHVLATLLFLEYSPLMHAIVYTFSRAPLRVRFPNYTLLEERHILIYDGNISYFGAKHIPIFILGIVCIITLFFFTISLLLNQCLQRRSNLFCLRWIEKWRPFFEVYTGPCRDNTRFWPGLLMIMRIFFIIFFTYSSSNAYSLEIAAFSVLLMSFSCIFPHGMYKKRALNVLEFSFFLNLCITSIFLSTTHHHHFENVFHTSVLIVMFTFGGIVTYHICVRFKIKTLCIKHVKPKPRALELIHKIHNKQHVALCCFKSESGDHDETARLVSSHKEDFQYE